jgi:hypothetical protein
MRFFTKVLALLAAVLILGASTVADATTMILLTREELVQRAELIVRVRVGRSETMLSEDGRAIVTRTELSPTRLLKGKADGKLWVQQFGGTYGGRTQAVLGDGKLRAGEEAIVFLRRDGKGTAYLTALAQSVYHIDDKGIARRDLSAAMLLRVVDGKPQPVAHVEEPEAVERLMTDIVRLAGGN